MQSLRDLGLQARWIYEVLVTTFSGGVPHATPIGVWTEDFTTLHMDLYGESQTLRNMRVGDCFAANFPTDEHLLFSALLRPDELAYRPARCVQAPLLCDTSAAVELRLDRAVPSPERTRGVGEVVHVHTCGDVKLINRAASLLVESLVVASRLPRLDRTAALATLTEYSRVVRRVAPRSRYETAMAQLLQTLGVSS